MHYIFILPVLLLILAAFLWYAQARSPAKSPSHSPGTQPQNPEIASHTIEVLTAAVTALQALMEHPALGGPGFLTIRIQQSTATVTAQYPNIQETLYRRIVRQELTPSDLLAEGFPEPLLEMSPEFETESGGMVLITVQISAPDPFLTQSLSSHSSRQTALNVLASNLRRRCPDLSVRIVGGELILAPVREPLDV